MPGTGHLPCTALPPPPITPGIGNLSHYKMPRGCAFHSGEAQETSPYKHRLQKGETAGDNGLLCLLESAGTAHTKNQSTQESHARLGQPELLLGSHQWEAFPGTLLGSSTELSSQQHLGPPQLLCLQGFLGLLVFLRAQQ